MDKSWIKLRDRLCKEYTDGIESFISLAKKHVDKRGLTRCPCKNCLNTVMKRPCEVEGDLYTYGMSFSYNRWVYHGEAPDFSFLFKPTETPNKPTETQNVEKESEMLELLNDLTSGGGIEQHGEDNSIRVETSDSTRGKNKKYQSMFDEVNEELYPGCTKISSLTFLVKLMHIKVLHRWSNKSFDMLIKLLKEAFPDGIKIPETYYGAKKALSDLGLGYECIDACKNDCMLFWKENKTTEVCLQCNEPRYKTDNKKGKKIPHKILRHFSLKQRLQRLFSCKHSASDMRWHKEKRMNIDGVLRHPADAEAWKDFDRQHAWFAEDPRNVRLALATDGFNPFGNLSTSYSTWPVILIPYNLPPWKCMKESFFFMSLLIPGPKSPGKEIDVYLQPLIDELKDLWSNGIETYDAHSGQNFRLHAALMWTINDFPAYGNLSGWSTKGYKACPVCNEDITSISLHNKICYMGHRRFLPMNHSWRKNKQFNGKTEYKVAPRSFSGLDVLHQLEDITFPPFGKTINMLQWKRKRLHSELNWVKKSIFFELPYWSSLKIRHKLDVMHIEKNICDNVLGTLLNIEGKTKDTDKARKDLMSLNIRKELHLQRVGNKLVKPHASYTLTIDERKKFCGFLKKVKFPDSFASNISRCVNAKDGKIYGLKSHDSHVLLQRLLPAGVRPFLPKDVIGAVAELSNFFKELTAKTLKVETLNKLQESIVIILCKFERIFPPAFFDVMVHLAVHLPEEAKLVGPVAYSWMYPIERSLRTLKQYVKNKARPEGSIAEAFTANEALTFCSMYLHGIETKFNRTIRNDDVIDSRTSNNNGCLPIFSLKARPTGHPRSKELSSAELKKAHWYILTNCEEVDPYRREHEIELNNTSEGDIPRMHETQFPKWFENKIYSQAQSTSNEVVRDLYALSRGPDSRIRSFSGCNVNGVRFTSKKRDNRLTTQNSGICVFGGHDSEGTNFYGIIKEVIELQYVEMKQVILFRCDWFDTNSKKNRIREDTNFTSIDTRYFWYQDDPFILASQAQQVFYVDDLSLGNGWKIVQRIQHRHLWDIPEIEEVDLSDEVGIHPGVVEDIDFETQTFHRVDVNPTVVCENIEMSEMILDDEIEIVDDEADEEDDDEDNEDDEEDEEDEDEDEEDEDEDEEKDEDEEDEDED